MAGRTSSRWGPLERCAVALGLTWLALCHTAAAVPAKPFEAGFAAIPVPTERPKPAEAHTLRWLFESCVGTGPLKMGLPGIAAQIFFFAPLIEMRTIIKEETTGRMPMLPFSAMVVNGAMWLSYGVMVDKPAIFVPNIPCFVMGAIYTAIFAWYVPPHANWLPGARNDHLKGIAVMVGCTLCLDFAPLRPETTARALGLAACAICVVMFSGPLVAIQTVLNERSTRTLSFPMTLATVLNCALWTFYGAYFIDDPFVYVPNGLGLAAGIAQSSLFLKFGISSSEKEIAKA